MHNHTRVQNISSTFNEYYYKKILITYIIKKKFYSKFNYKMLGNVYRMPD